MPRAFLITNRRYELTPPPPAAPDVALAMAPLPPAFAFIFRADVQEEAEDLSLRKRHDSAPQVLTRKASLSSDAEGDVSPLSFRQVSHEERVTIP